MQVGYRTHVGQIRKVNEDALWCDQRLLVVADGMGGAAAGEIASQLAIDALRNWSFPRIDRSDDTLHRLKSEARRAVEAANQKVYDHATKNPEFHGMGTTLTMGLFHHDRMVVAHVGDSRAYLHRRGELRQLTDDHSVVAEMLRAGGLSDAQAQTHPYRNMLTRALGVAGDICVDVDVVSLGAGDTILLCTDGLTSVVSDVEISNVIGRHSNPQAVADALVFLANERGGPDNISVIVAYPGGPGDV